MSRPRRIDVHHHFLPHDYALMLRDKGITPGGIPLPTWTAPLAAKIMGKVGVDTAILSVSAPGVWFGDARQAAHWARSVNDSAAAVVSAAPHSFGFFATLTLPDVDGAVAEAEHALDVLGADGIVLLANNAGLYLGDPAFDRLLGMLNERSAVVFVHPGELPAEPVPGMPTFTADFLLDTTRSAISLILSGQLEKYDRIRWILAHAGGFVPYIAHRIVLTMLSREPKWRLAAVAVNRKGEAQKRMEIIRRLWFDVALSSTPTTLPTLLTVADPTKVLYGTDFPFAPPPAVRYMRDEYELTSLTPEQRQRIDRGNALALFPRLT